MHSEGACVDDASRTIIDVIKFPPPGANSTILAAVLGVSDFTEWFGKVYRQKAAHWRSGVAVEPDNSHGWRAPTVLDTLPPIDPLLASTRLTLAAFGLDALMAELHRLRTPGWTKSSAHGPDSSRRDMEFERRDEEFERKLDAALSVIPVLSPVAKAWELTAQLESENAALAMRKWIASDASVIFKLEMLLGPACMPVANGAAAGVSVAAGPLLELRHDVDAAIGYPTTVHIYVNGRVKSQTLDLHADSSDVVVVQLNGTKTWEICEPSRFPSWLETSGARATGLSPAALSATHELHIRARWDERARRDILLQRREQRRLTAGGDSSSGGSGGGGARSSGGSGGGGDGSSGSSSSSSGSGGNGGSSDGGSGSDYFVTGSPYDGIDLQSARYECGNHTLVAGDRLYLPFGTLHRAITGVGGSAHLTLELMHTGLTWADLVLAAVDGHHVDDPLDLRMIASLRRAGFTAEISTVGAAMLRLALRHEVVNDPRDGSGPVEVCPKTMCLLPDALTATSAELAAPVPLWGAALGSAGGHSDGGEAAPAPPLSPSAEYRVNQSAMLYTAYTRIVSGALASQLRSVPPPPWSLKLFQVGPKPTTATPTDPQAAATDAGASPKERAVRQLVAELSTAARFDAGMRRLLHRRDQSLKNGACPG
jgi:hypothetical protein